MPAPGVRLGELIERLGGELRGPADRYIDRVAPLASAGPSAIAFFVSGGASTAALEATRAAAVILSPADAERTSAARILTQNPYLYFARVSQILNPTELPAPGVHPSAVVDPSASVSEAATIGPQAVVGPGVRVAARAVIGPGVVLGANVAVGEDTVLHAHVAVYAGVHIGVRCIVHAGAVIGADGFGFAPDRGSWVKIPQVGSVVIHDDVEIGANTTIDRGALDDTVIETGVKLDNQIQVGHNCRIGAHTAIAGCVGIAGSTRIGRNCMIGGAAMISGHLEIADRVVVAGGTLVSRSIDESGTYAGPFPFDKQRRWQRTAVHLRNIDALVERVKALEDRLGRVDGERPSRSRKKE